MLAVQKSRQATISILSLLVCLFIFGSSHKLGAAGVRTTPGNFLLESFPTVKQLRNYCGPAVLCSVLKFWGQDIDQKDIGTEIFDKKIQATNGADMLLYAIDKGYRAYSWNSSIDDLKLKLAEGMPVIVLTDSSLTDKSGHYRVAIGYDDAKQLVKVMDPYETETHSISYAVFTKLWRKHGNWGLLIVPEPQDKFKKELYEKNPVVHMDLAYVYYRKGKLNDAAEAGGKALALEPENPDVLSLMTKVKRDLQYAAGAKKSDK